MKDIDLLVEQPVTGGRIAVQVKSRADQNVLDACVTAFEASDIADRFYFVCHSATGTLTVPTDAGRPTTIWAMPEIAAAAVDAGLVDCQIGKAM